MSKKQTKKIYNLQGYILDKIEQSDNGDILLFCHIQRKSMRFLSQTSIAVSTKRKRRIKHQVFEGRIVWIILIQRRFYFSSYNKRLWEKLPSISTGKRTSNIYRKNTVCDLQNSSYTHSAFIRKSSAMFAPRLIDELPAISVFWPEGTICLGLDGKNIGKHKQMFTLADIKKNQLLAAIPPMAQAQLVKTIKGKVAMKERLLVREICIDMDKFMRSVAQKCFPEARIVIDQFHVIQHAVRCLDKYRRRLQKVHKINLSNLKYLLAKHPYKLTKLEKAELDLFLEQAPKLKNGYSILQELRFFYRQSNATKGEIQLKKVMSLCQECKIPDMLDLKGTLGRWFNEIVNYHISHTTNAFVEGIHTRFEMIKRNHFGVRNIDRFVKRLMYIFLPPLIFLDLLSTIVG